MIDWYVEISEWAPDSFKCDDYLAEVIDTAKPCMDYFCDRLSNTEKFTKEETSKIFSEIIEELPIMKSRISNGEFIIEYNRWVFIRLIDTTKQIYREIKLEKIFN